MMGALLVAALVGSYVLLGAPGLHDQIANAPATAADVTVQSQLPHLR